MKMIKLILYINLFMILLNKAKKNNLSTGSPNYLHWLQLLIFLLKSRRENRIWRLPRSPFQYISTVTTLNFMRRCGKPPFLRLLSIFCRRIYFHRLSIFDLSRPFTRESHYGVPSISIKRTFKCDFSDD